MRKTEEFFNENETECEPTVENQSQDGETKADEWEKNPILEKERMFYETYAVKKPVIPQGYTEETFNERNEIRKAAKTVGLPFILVFALTVVFSVIGIVRGILISYTGTDPLPFFSDLYFEQLLQIVSSTLIFIFPFFIALKCEKLKVSEVVSLSKPEKDTFLPCFLMGVAMCEVANIASVVMGNFFYSIGIHYEVPRNENPDGILGVLLVILSTAVIPPLVEEFALRGVVMGRLLPYGEGFATVVSAIMFGVLHGNFEQMPFAFAVGLALGFVRLKTGSIWTCVAIHAFNNATAVVFDYFVNDLPDAQLSAIYTVFYAVLLFVGIIGLYIYNKSGKTFSAGANTCTLSVSKKFYAFFTSPIIIVSCALYFSEAILYFFI